MIDSSIVGQSKEYVLQPWKRDENCACAVPGRILLFLYDKELKRSNNLLWKTIVNISYLKILLKNRKCIKNMKLNHEKFRRKLY